MQGVLRSAISLTSTRHWAPASSLEYQADQDKPTRKRRQRPKSRLRGESLAPNHVTGTGSSNPSPSSGESSANLIFGNDSHR